MLRVFFSSECGGKYFDLLPFFFFLLCHQQKPKNAKIKNQSVKIAKIAKISNRKIWKIVESKKRRPQKFIERKQTHTHKEKTKGADRKKALLLFYLTIFLLAIFILHTLLLGQSVGGFRHFTSNFLFWPEKNQSGQETKRPLAKRRRSVGTKHCECKQNSSKPYLFMTRLGQDKAQRL